MHQSVIQESNAEVFRSVKQLGQIDFVAKINMQFDHNYMFIGIVKFFCFLLNIIDFSLVRYVV